jgi:hypothetical protein
MASSSPSGEIRQLLGHVYPGGSKGPGAERITVFYGRRGRPGKKPRFIPAQLAHQWARKLQARRPGGSAARRGFLLLSTQRLTPMQVALQLCTEASLDSNCCPVGWPAGRHWVH